MSKIKVLSITGEPKKSEEELKESAKALIAKGIANITEVIYGAAIMNIADLEELNNYMLECIVDAKKEYSDMTKGDFIKKIVDEFEEL